MKKLIIILITSLFLTNCGYTPIYSSKKFDFNLKKIINSNNDPLNSIINKKLQNFSNQESQKIITLKIDGQEKINTLAKNSKGDPSRYEMVINIKLEATFGENKKINKSFQEKFNYNANTNKFELSQYEKEIKNLLINRNINRIIVYLTKT
tara:strand:+ start:785 stop:1237 length:453 start_codon:yes stop_codon:yes gene_type:complete